MNITFKSEKFGDHEWRDFKPQKMPTTDAESIESVTSMTFVEWGQALMNGSTICGRALVWVLLRRENRGLRFKEVVYPIDAFKVELDDEEKTKLREALAKDDDMSDEDKRQVLLSLGESELDQLDFEPAGDGQGNSSTAESGSESS